jgi:hypothetical protein
MTDALNKVNTGNINNMAKLAPLLPGGERGGFLGVAFDWLHLQSILIAGISAALAYLLKSLSTNSRNQLFTKEPG